MKRVKKEESVKPVRTLSEFMGSTEKKINKRYKDNDPRKQWFNYETGKKHDGVEAALTVLETAQVARRMLNIKFSRLYSNMEAIGFPYANLQSGANRDSSSQNKITLNIIQSVIDAVAAKVAKDQPKASFVTTGARDYFLPLRAQKLTKYMSGLFKQAQVYENSESVFRDAGVVGTGFLHILEQDSKITSEWCAQDEVRVDELDGMKQEPRSMMRVTLVPKDRLIDQFPEFEREIQSAQSALQGKVQITSTTEMVRKVESWHLPTSKKAKNGVHCITIENCDLFEEEYNKDFFPIIPFRWYNRPLGFFGRSITEEILTIQIEINKILKTIQQSQELAACPIILVPNEAEISEDVLLTNTIARMVPYSGGNAPTFVVPTAQNPEVYQHLNSLIQWAFQIVGLSQTSASGMKPAGVDSAVAIREVSDIETGRFAQVGKRWENFFCEVARVMTDMSRDLYLKDPKLSVSLNVKKMLEEIKWKDVDLQDNPFDIQVFPTSQLPDQPAGRIQTVSEYIDKTWISKERGMELMQLDPDLEQEVNIQTASLRLTEKWLSEMVEDGIPKNPDPLMNLALAQQTAQGVYTQLVLDGCPEDRLSLVRRFANECKRLQAEALAKQQAAQAPPPMDPSQMQGPPPQQQMPMQ